jgi:EmrB/QacA subfamily drug resistance transporter
VSAQVTAPPRPPAGLARPPAPPAAPPARDNYKWVAAAVVMIGALMTILDQTIVNVAINSLQNDFNVSVSDIQWVFTGYTLGLGAVIPMSGWLADRFGSKAIFMASVIGFTVTSALCGLAVSAQMLVAVRVLQGLAGGLIMPVGMAIMMRNSRPEERGRMMAVLGAPMMLAPILGPTLGGWLIQSASWRLIFYINVPIGIVGALAAYLFLRGQAGSSKVEPLDWKGLVLASPAVVGIVYGLAQPSQYGWGSWQTLLPMLGGAALLVIFVLYELRQPYPLIQMRIFTDQAFTSAMLLSVVVVISLFGSVLLMPLFLQQVQGYGTLDTGIILGAQGVGALIAMPIAGNLADRLGAAKVVPFGLSILFVSTLWSTTLAPDTSRETIVLMLGMRGLGMGFSMMVVFSAAFVTLRPEFMARATSVSNTIQRVGSAFGVAIMTTILSSRVAANLPSLPGGASAARSSGSVSGAHLPDAVKTVLLQQVAKGFDDTFWIAAGLVLLGIPVAMTLRKALRPEVVRAYGLRQLSQGIVLGAAARWVERRPESVNGHGPGLPTEPRRARQVLTEAAGERLQTGMTVLRMGTNAAGLVPTSPLPWWLWSLVALTSVGAVIGLVICFSHGLQPPTVPTLHLIPGVGTARSASSPPVVPAQFLL